MVRRVVKADSRSVTRLLIWVVNVASMTYCPVTSPATRLTPVVTPPNSTSASLTLLLAAMVKLNVVAVDPAEKEVGLTGSRVNPSELR